MIIPTILEKNFGDIEELVRTLENVADLIQIDVADDKLVNGLTFLDVDKFSELNTNTDLELHFMVKNPSEYLHGKIKGVKKVCCQVEALQDVPAFIKKAKELGYVTGLSIEAETDYMVLNDFLDDIDYVQFVCVEPGGQGRKFIYAVIDKIKKYLKAHPDLKVQADGGINETTLPLLVELGINDLTVGSEIVRSSNPKEIYLKYSGMLKEKEGTVNTIAGQDSTSFIKQIAFLGGAAWKPNDQPYIDAYETAKLLAENGYEIVNGGGPGVMEASTKGAHDVGKKVLAVTYHPNKPKRHYEGVNVNNTFDTEVITLDYFDRTKVMLQTTQAHIVFKGSLGTLSEFGMSWISSWIHEPDNKPIILFGAFWQDFIDVINKHMLVQKGEEKLLKICTTPQEVLKYLDSLNNL